MNEEDRAIGSLLGLAIGDAFGVSQEIIPRFGGTPDELHSKVLSQRKKRRQFRGIQTNMEGGGPFLPSIKLKPGEYTDDTSMALCLADSLIACQKLDAHDLMERFTLWLDEGYNASRYAWDESKKKFVGTAWGVGSNVAKAIQKFKKNRSNAIAGGTDPMRDAGNGSIMRLSPVAIFYHQDIDAAISAAKVQSSVTHNVVEALDACAYLAQIIVLAIEGLKKEEIFLLREQTLITHLEIKELTQADAAWKLKTEDQIRTLPGRALWSLEAALWVITHTNSFKDAIITAANLGGDADTVSAIVGQIAGALYGASSIPEEWRSQLTHAEAISRKAKALFHHSPDNGELSIYPK
jgi:ADP-ribosyl-[dinitrogen reductase] hydrolase